jgi:hypothetical protein
MANSTSDTGLTHLGKTALPLIGRIGTVAGGIVSLLAIFETISGEIVTTVFAFSVVAVFVVTAIVVFYQTTQVVDEKPIRVYSYSQRARTFSAIVMTLAAFFLLGLMIHFGANLIKPLQRDNWSVFARPTPRVSLSPTPDRFAKPGVLPTIIPTALPTATSTATFSPALPTRTLTVTPFPIEQMTDVNTLVKLGNDANTAKNYLLAVNYFARALQIDATDVETIPRDIG